MQSSAKKSKYSAPISPAIQYLMILPIIFIISAVPLVVYLHVTTLTGDVFDFWTGSRNDYDFFSYYKMICLLIGTFLTSAALVLSFSKGYVQIKRTYFYVPIAVYSLIVILSTIFSKYKTIAVLGFVERYEGAMVLISYMVLLFASINFIDTERKIKLVLYSLCISALVIGIIGIFQYIGHDPFQYYLVKKLIVPAKYENLIPDINIKIKPGIAYSTLYNPNYLGSYTAMIFPLSFALFVLYGDIKQKAFFGAIAAIMFINLIASQSRTGMIASALAVIILSAMLIRRFEAVWKPLAVGAIIISVIFVSINGIYHNGLVNRISTIFKVSSEQYAKIDDIAVADNHVFIKNGHLSVTIEINDGSLSFKDLNGKTIPMVFNKANGTIVLQEGEYKDYSFVLGNFNGQPALQITNMKLTFLVTNNSFVPIDNKGKAFQIKPVKRWNIGINEMFASTRGYIWSRTIPLLKDTILIGFGPDTFALYFPQYDIVGKINVYGDPWRVVDKPHNLYLQVAVNTGLVSLVSLIGLFILYIIQSIRIYNRAPMGNFLFAIGISIFSAVCGFIVSGLANDSVISVSPVFWILLGVGISVNYMFENLLGKMLQYRPTASIDRAKNNMPRKTLK